MGLRHQMTQPWGIVAAAVIGGLAAVVTIALAPAAAAIAVGIVVALGAYLVKVVLGVLVVRGREPEGPPSDLPAPPRGSAADGWLRRAQAALTILQQQASSPADALLRGQVEEVAERATAVVGDLRRLAGQTTVVERAMNRVDPGGLARSAEDLRGAARNSSGALHEEKQRAVRAIEDQIAVYERLAEVRRGQLARLESATLGLEGLSARLAELLALHASTELPGGSASLPHGPAEDIGELSDDLDGLRAGLAETEELSRQVLARDGAARETGATPGSGAM